MEPLLRVDTASIDRAHKALRTVPGGLAKVLERGANRAARGMRTDANRAGRKIYGLKAKTINRDVRTIKAFAKAGKWNAGIDVRLKAKGRLSLMQYGARRTKRGVSVQVRKDKGRKVMPSAFMARQRRGTGEDAKFHGEAVFVRKGKARLPIKKLTGPGVKSVLLREKVREDVTRRALGRYTERLPQEVKQMLRSRLPK